MGDDKVTFKANGDYTIGQPLSEMDVHRESTGVRPTPTGTGTYVPTAPSVGKSVSKKFDLSQLKKKLGGGKAKEASAEEPAPIAAEPESVPEPTTEPVPAPVVESTPESVPPTEEAPSTPAVEPVVEEPKTDEVVSEEGTHSTLNVDSNYPPLHVPGVEPPIPAYEPSTPAPQQVFKLDQLGLGTHGVTEPTTPSEPKESVQELNLGSVEIPKADAPATVAEEVKPATPVEPPKRTEEKSPPFIFHKLDEFLQLTGVERGTLSAFAKGAYRASMRGVDMCQSKVYELLRSYSIIIPPRGKRVPSGVKYVMTIGWDVHVTACYLSESFVISDGSTNLKCVGDCAFMFDTPVALSSERNRPAGANV